VASKHTESKQPASSDTEICRQCLYSYGALRRPALAPELRIRSLPYSVVLTEVDPGRLRAHPRPGTWSVLEYACHVRDLHRVQRTRIARAGTEDQPDFASMRREERVTEERYNDQDPGVVAAEVTAAADDLARLLEALDDDGWARTGVYHWPTTEVRTVDWIARHTVHESVHHFSDIERLLEEQR
jgi:DinB superfamily